VNARYFFSTYETIPPGAGFPQFGACHLLWLLFAAVFGAAACLWYRRAPDSARRRCRLYIAGFMLIGEALKQAVLLATGSFHWSYLPLHLCSINIFVCAAHALRPRRFAEEFLYAVCLPGAVLALLCPGWMQLPFWNFLHLHSFTVHIFLALYPLLLLAGGFAPDAGRLPGVFLCLAAVSPFIYWLDKKTGANFFFLNYPGEGNPLQWFYRLWGNPGYIAGFPILTAVLWSVLYLPWRLRHRQKAAPAAAPEREEKVPARR
jgi:hypothetical integral membrane protein (TIGR02206 family)